LTGEGKTRERSKAADVRDIKDSKESRQVRSTTRKWKSFGEMGEGSSQDTVQGKRRSGIFYQRGESRG